MVIFAGRLYISTPPPPRMIETPHALARRIYWARLLRRRDQSWAWFYVLLFKKGDQIMNIARTVKWSALAVLAFLVVVPPQAKADEWNQKTVITFSAPVEIPGQVLQPGTYVFKLADSASDRNIVEVFNKDENHLYGIFLAIPDYRLQPADKPIIKFEERAAGAPEAVKAWFYPGDSYGHDFVYPKAKAMALAKANNQPVPSMPNELAPNTTKPTKSMTEPHVMAMKQAALKAQKPSQEEVQVAQAFPPAKPAASVSSPARKELPKTASTLPLIALAGLGSLLAAATLRLLALGMK